MSALSPIACVELFHLLFLDQLGRKLDKKNYALKGGCNLRFYLRSTRYSEDIDLDVQWTPVDSLKSRVEQILTGSSFTSILQSRGLAIAQWSAPKQTETTQRWKLALSAKGHSLPLHTKIEFSRREGHEPTAFEPVDGLVIREHQLAPIFANHYTPEAALRQKVHALIHRAHVQARDLFDIDHLLRCGVSAAGMAGPRWKDAQRNAFSISFGDFKSQVLSFLAPADQARFDDSAVWDEMVLRVVDALKGTPE